MRRLSWSGLAAALLGMVALPVAAQRAPDRPLVTLEEPRPNPVLPAALVPFVIDQEVCRKDHVPTVSVKVYNVLANPVATLRLRGRRAEMLDDRPLRCGNYVAVWDGTIDGGTRVAPPGIYYLQLAVDDRSPRTRKVIVAQP
jgi:hypothetical protein